MGIYKVIKIKLPKWLQNKKVGVNTLFFKKFRTTGYKKTIPKKRAKKRRYQTIKTNRKRGKRKLKKGNINLKYVIIVLFFILILIKCVSLFTVQQQKESQNENIVTETKQSFLLQDSLPY